MYPNLFFDNWLWANMIWGAEWLCQVDWTKINDPVLLNLLRMGVLDWTGPNDCLHQSTQVIQHSTAMHLHILPQIMKLESRVRETDIRPFDSPTNISLQVDDVEWEWNAHGTQIHQIEADAKKNCQEVLTTTNQIEEAVMTNNRIFANKWEKTHDWINR